MSKIENIEAREILDSRGNPTVEVQITLSSGVVATAAVPSGASTGTFEALELRDGDVMRYGGFGVQKAVANVNGPLRDALMGMEVDGNQQEIDIAMLHLDGTENKSKFGANAILGISLAVCRAAAQEKKTPLYAYINTIAQNGVQTMHVPMPMFNVLNGGKHSDSGLCIQEFKIVPIGIATFPEQLRAGSEIFHALKKILEKNGYSSGVGDEGGFSPKLESNSQALSYIIEAIAASGYQVGKEIGIGLDAAASSFYDEQLNKYALSPEGMMLDSAQLVELYKQWIDTCHIISIEDGLAEEDWSGWESMNAKLGTGTMLIGDDLLVTNVKRLQKAIEEKACNSVLIKVNQIGTLSETIACIRLAKEHGMRTVVSHRSGETTDDFIADLAVGCGCEFIKSGSLSRGERICKYNRLLKINSELAE